MQQAAFHANHIAREMENMREEDCFSLHLPLPISRYFRFKSWQPLLLCVLPIKKTQYFAMRREWAKSRGYDYYYEKMAGRVQSNPSCYLKRELLRREHMKKQESQFFNTMRSYPELERRIKEIYPKRKRLPRGLQENLC